MLPSVHLFIGDCLIIFDNSYPLYYLYLFNFLCLGLIFLQVFHMSSVFESRTNFSRKTRLERQMIFRGDDAIYMHIYNTLAGAKDFRSGLENILRENHTEYLNTVNSIDRYSILPEIVIAYVHEYSSQSNVSFMK